MEILTSWFGWLVGELPLKLLGNLYEVASWFLAKLWWLFYTIWAELWEYCSGLIFSWIGEALSYLNIVPGDVVTIVAVLKTVNFYFPVDMIVTMLPGWFAFESFLFFSRLLVRAWR